MPVILHFVVTTDKFEVVSICTNGNYVQKFISKFCNYVFVVLASHNQIKRFE